MYRKRVVNKIVTSVLGVLFSLSVFASEAPSKGHEEKKEGFDAVNYIMHHVGDAHDWHLFDKTDEHGHAHAMSIPLPVILWTDNGLVTFMSSEFHHDTEGITVVEKNGLKFVNYHEKIYQLDGAQTFHVNHDTHEVHGAIKPIDLSLTKNVVTILIVSLIMILIFFSAAKQYRGGTIGAPKGIASWVEPLVVFVRDDIAKQNIGPRYERFMPFLLTIFFFIWFGNLLGLVPFISNPNMTGSISITITLAAITWVIQMVHTKKAYWSHIFKPPGVPAFVLPILVPIEIAGIFIKPITLLIRLFANITAGHIIVLALISVIFITENIGWAALSVPMALFISVLELLVAFLQAYIFTMLAALYIGSAVEEAHH